MNTPVKSRLSVIEKIGFGSGDAAVNIVWSALAIIITFFYTDVYRLNVAHIAMLGLLPRLIDAFADVAMGIFTDGRSTRWGRYRPYLFAFAVPFGLSIMLVFTTPDFSYTGKLIWAYVTYTMMMLVFTCITIPYISLPAVLTDDPQQRLSANGYRLFFAKGASLLVNTFVPVFAARWGQAHIAQGYHVAMTVMAVVATLLFFFCFFTTKERVVHKNDKKPLGEQMKLLLTNSQWTVLAGVCIVGTVGYVIRGSVGLYYAKYFLGGDAALQAAFITVGIVGNILAMVASTWLTKVFCKIQVFRFSQLVTFALSVAMYFAVKPGGVTAAFVLYFLINFIVDLQGPVFWSIISEAVDYGQVKQGKRVAGLAFGGISFCQKMGMSIAAGIVGVLLTFFHYQPDVVQSAYTLNGIALMLTVIPGVFHLGMGLLMYGYFITDDYYNRNIRPKVTHETP
ncbi:MFS transporter [Rhizomicrobium electricum]|uniref:MFS transporter n=1 Tax=Rhizomicrobium electricum TaxID=480070 RepID=A0ABN1FE12_9PROT|nr:MFS transporter [Rhizomicrobium electricum]NIJ50843.1 GPH family glycoside/pentoside/hexuronide:cation symporter [Rhizomicrobium electricum]